MDPYINEWQDFPHRNEHADREPFPTIAERARAIRHRELMRALLLALGEQLTDTDASSNATPTRTTR